MKFTVCLILLFFQTVFVYPQNNNLAETDPDAVLAKTVDKLNSLQHIRYNNLRELNYSSENYTNTSAWKLYVDFETNDTITGFKYQIDDAASKQVFNGSEKFELDKKGKTIHVNDSPTSKSMGSLSALYNSLITLKNIIPLIIADKAATKTITDTTINNKLYNAVTVNTGKRRIQNLGKGFDEMTTKSNFIYTIIIAKDNYLPFEIVQKNDLNSDFIKTVFSNIETNTNAPSEISWYYSTYADEFKRAADLPAQPPLPMGSLAPEWKLALYDKEKMISLHDLKGGVILLDFWIKNCGPCIQSVPHLNGLQHKFRDKNLRIISINSYDSKEEVRLFCNKHKTNYSVLLNGKEVAEEYGVYGFPAFFVIDKKGKIIYANIGYDAAAQSAVERVIENAL